MADRAEPVKLDDLQLRICSYSDLVAMNEATARDQDRLDLISIARMAHRCRRRRIGQYRGEEGTGHQYFCDHGFHRI